MLRLLFPLVAVAAFAPPRRAPPALLRRGSAAIDTDVDALLKSLDADGVTRADAVRALGRLRDRGAARLFNSTELQPNYRVTKEQLKTVTRAPGDLADVIGVYGSAQADKIAAVTMGVIFGAMASATVAQAWCPGPDIVRFSVVWALASVPYGFLTLGIQLPGLVQTLITRSYVVLFPSYRMRLLRHEAGHMLVGHLLGLPCAAVAANSAAAAVQVRARERSFPPFFSSDGFSPTPALPLTFTTAPPRNSSTTRPTTWPCASRSACPRAPRGARGGARRASSTRSRSSRSRA